MGAIFTNIYAIPSLDYWMLFEGSLPSNKYCLFLEKKDMLILCNYNDETWTKGSFLQIE